MNVFETWKPPSVRLAAYGWLLTATCYTLFLAMFWTPGMDENTPVPPLVNLLNGGQSAGLLMSVAGFLPLSRQDGRPSSKSEKWGFTLVKVAWFLLFLVMFVYRD
jgi:hypothetical protein